MALKPDHISYHCAKESDDSDPVSMGWTVAGADLEEGKGRIRMVKVSLLFCKIATDDDLDKDKYTFTLSDPKKL
jgi:hypothetical protein